jgi:hypothetical protein
MLCTSSGTLVSDCQYFLMQLGIHVHPKGKMMLVRSFKALVCVLEIHVTFKACIFARNHVGKAPFLYNTLYLKQINSDYAVAVWAVHRLGGVASYVCLHQKT